MENMKYLKSTLCMLFAGILFLSVILTDAVPVAAAEREEPYHVLWDTDADKVHIKVKDFRVPYVCIDFPAKGYRVTNIKTDSTKLRAKVVKRSVAYVREIDEQQIVTESFRSAYDCVGLYAAKQGIYNYTFDIADSFGQIVKSKSIKVYANNDEPINYIKVNGIKKNKSNKELVVDKKDAKIEVKMNSGYKLNKIVLSCSYRQNDGFISTIKNKGKFKLDTNEIYQVTIFYQDKYTDQLSKNQFLISRW